MERIHGLVYEHNGVRVMDFCLQNNHDMCRDERGQGSYICEDMGRNWTDSHDSSYCQCPCHDKRTSKYKLLKNKFKMKVYEYLMAGNKGVRSSFDWTFYYINKEKGITSRLKSDPS